MLTGQELIAQFPAVWLRDNCSCGECRDPGTGQKLFGIVDLPEDLAVAGVWEDAGTVTVEFAPDGHRSAFGRTQLAELRLDGAVRDLRAENTKTLWRAADLIGHLPEADWTAYLTDKAVLARCLAAVLRFGFVILRSVPREPGTVLRVAETFGYVRETNYSRLFDVEVKTNPNNLAFTRLPITPHTDNPYRDPVPTLQLLHCLTNTAEGGESGLVDGFQAAALLRQRSPIDFETLVRTAVPFAFRDAESELRAERPLIEIDGRGQIRGVRFSNRHVQPLRLLTSEVGEFYSAYRRFAELVYDPELLLTFRLDPGDCLVFDNTRVLHARTAFDTVGSRHLQDCYAGLDGLESTLAVSSRLLAARQPGVDIVDDWHQVGD